MVQIGKKVKYDSYGRVTLPAELAELLDLIKGEDEVTWCVEDGRVCLNKVTKIYSGGFDFESKDIEVKLRDYEGKYISNKEVEVIDPKLLEKHAREEYEKDKVTRETLRKKLND